MLVVFIGSYVFDWVLIILTLMLAFTIGTTCLRFLLALPLLY